MIRLLVLIVLIGIIGYVLDQKPAANLTFLSIQKKNDGYAVEFYSDIDIEALFASSSTRKIVSRKLVCALESDHNFSVKHNMARFFRGGLEFQGPDSHKVGQYRYLSNGLFYFSFDNGSRLANLSEDEVIHLVGDKKEIECKVVMTVFLSNPYYSRTMKIPVGQVVEVLRMNDGSLSLCPDHRKPC